jgi:hypothetical protein
MQGPKDESVEGQLSQLRQSLQRVVAEASPRRWEYLDQSLQLLDSTLRAEKYRRFVCPQQGMASRAPMCGVWRMRRWGDRA